MHNQQTETQDTSGQLPDALRHDETTLEYINAEDKLTQEEELPTPPEDHVEVLADGEQYIVHDPARDSFDLDHSAPLYTPTAQQIQKLAASKSVSAEALTADRQAHIHEAMRPEEETQTAAEMLQDDWIDEQQMLDMAQIDDVLDPVETE